MGSPQDAALRHRLSSICAVIQYFETDLSSLSPLGRPDVELLIRFFKDAEKNAKNEIELHELMQGGLDARRRACANPERYITNAPAPPLSIRERTPPRPRLSREEQIARKKADLESELRKAEARGSELKETIEHWYLCAFPEWERVTADARERWRNRYTLAIEQFGALKSRAQMYGLPSIEKQAGRAVLTPIPNAPASPFRWSEIHADAKERIHVLESAIEGEVQEAIEPVPQTGAAREQFFVLLEERANTWADRGLRAYLDCLEQVGRSDAPDAKTAIWKNGLLFFTTESISRLMHVACGIGKKEREWMDLRYPSGSPPQIALLKDASNRIWNIGIRVRDRTYRELFGQETGGWLAQTQRLLQQLGSTPSQKTGAIPTPRIATVPPGEPSAASVGRNDPESLYDATTPEKPSHPPLSTKRDQTPSASRRGIDADFWVAEDFRSVHFDGLTHVLTITQGQMMKVLYQAHQADRPVVSKEKLLSITERETSEVRDTWRESALWNTLIVSTKRGTYRLNVPTEAELAREKLNPGKIPGKYRDSTGHLPGNEN